MTINLHSPEVQLAAAVGAIAIALLLVILARFLVKRRPKNLKVSYFQKRWQELQKLCASKDTWPLAVINADKLLEEALKKRHFKGKSMGEKLVAAQREIRDNDAVWFGHKLRNQLVHEAKVNLTQRKVKDALLGIKTALKDLGALK